MIRSLDELVATARRLGPVRVAVAAGHDPDAIEGMAKARALGLAEGVFVGDAARIEVMAADAGLPLAPDQVIPAADDVSAVRQAIALVREQKADLVMKGKLSTATMVHAILDRETGLRTGRLLSQVVVFQVPGADRLMLLTDAAINIAPTLDQKADICRNVIEVAHALGIDHPNVALLCALELVKSEMPATVDAAALVQMNRRGQIERALLEGPIALDAVLSRFAAERKGIDSPIVEATDVLVAPDVEAANILYRSILYFAHAQSGGVVVGAKVPLVLLSRAEPPETKIHSIALAILVAAAVRA
jgi:phosphate butyryltransferase